MSDFRRRLALRQRPVHVFAIALLLLPWSGMRGAVAISINEIRTNQFGSQDDEYFELIGSPGESLDDLTYLVIGDDAVNGSGVIEAVIDLDGLELPDDDGIFLGAEITFGAPGTAFEDVDQDGTFTINFENRQNRTHLLVSGFFGSLNDDLDTEADGGDGTLDLQPWSDVLDAVGIVEDPDTSPMNVDHLYAMQLGGENVGPTVNDIAPGHVFRLPDGTGGWVIGDFSLDPNTDDTPGSMNGAVDDQFTCDFVDALVATIAAGTNSSQYDLDNDGDVDIDDLVQWRIEAGAVLTTSGNPVQEGDANLDGIVDGLDYIEWNDHKFTATAAWCAGDFNADGIVDGLDFILWNDNKFTAADVVPEPSMAALSWVLLLCLWAGRSRLRKCPRVA